MSTKIYEVIEKDIYMEGGVSSVYVKVFTNKDTALKYLHQQIELAKQDVDDLEGYCVDEDNESYERYLDGYASQDCISIWLVEDVLNDEKVLEHEENEYEIDTP